MTYRPGVAVDGAVTVTGPHAPLAPAVVVYVAIGVEPLDTRIRLIVTEVPAGHGPVTAETDTVPPGAILVADSERAGLAKPPGGPYPCPGDVVVGPPPY